MTAATFQVGEPTGIDHGVDPPRIIYGRWHAARIGPGLLCQLGSPDGCIWEPGDGKVTCSPCITAVLESEGA